MNYSRSAIVLMVFGIALLAVSPASADVGQIIGTVLDEKSGEPLIGASVQLEGTSIGAACDIDGRFVIRNVPHGTHSILVASLGYTPKRITEVAVLNGEPVKIDASLTEAVTELKPIEVTAERARATESAVLIKRRAAVNVTDGMSAEMIKKAGDANAGDALRRVVGVSVVDGRSLVVRGMGGRYSTVQLNGASLPSAEPEKREVPLDLFPGSLLDEVTASKTFTPDKPGTFTGGSVDLSTREFPTGLSYGVSGSRSFNSATTGEEMPSYDGGDLDWLGFDDGTRELPAGARDGDWGFDRNNPETHAPNQELGRSLSNQWTPRLTRAPWNSSFGANLGNTYTLGETTKLGLLASLSYSNSYRLRHEVYRQWSETSPSLDLRISRGTQSVLWGSLVNFTLSATDRHKIGFKGLYNRSADDEARTATGWYEQDGMNILDTRLKFTERYIGSGQLAGEHHVAFPFKSLMAWRLQLAGAGNNEPDTRSNRFNLFEDENGDTLGAWVNSHYSGVHIFQNVRDDNAQLAYDWSIPFGDASRVKTGFLFENKTRDQEVIRLRYNNSSSGSPLRVGTGEEIFADTNIGPSRDQYFLESLTFPDDAYDVNEHTLASYAQLEATLISGLRFVGGARYEDYDMSLHTGDRSVPGGRILVDQNQADWMPMGSLILSLSDRMSVRAVVSRTIARPEFRELAPFQYQDLAVGRPTQGNPGLRKTSILNYDLRWEYYTHPGDVLAVSFFAKSFTDPIERIVTGYGQSTPINTYENADGAKNLGVEFEAREVLTFLPGKLSRLSIGGNLTLIAAEVTLQSRDRDQTTKDRPLQGQSPWTANLNLGYLSSDGRTDMTIVYNGFGKRISAIDADPRLPWYEQPRHMVDLTFGHKLWSTLGMKLGIKNILNEKYQVTQEQVQEPVTGQTIVLEEYELGRLFSLSFSYGL